MELLETIEEKFHLGITGKKYYSPTEIKFLFATAVNDSLVETLKDLDLEED
jgi:hypothetical protein